MKMLGRGGMSFDELPQEGGTVRPHNQPRPIRGQGVSNTECRGLGDERGKKSRTQSRASFWFVVTRSNDTRGGPRSNLVGGKIRLEK